MIKTIVRPLCPHGKSSVPIKNGGPGSSVGIAPDYGLDGPGSNPGGDEIFTSVQTGPGAHPDSCKWVPGLIRGKVRPGRAADHSPPSSAAVMEV